LGAGKINKPLADKIASANYQKLSFAAGVITGKIFAGMIAAPFALLLWVRNSIVGPLEKELKDADTAGLSYQAGELTRKAIEGLVKGLPEWVSWVRNNIVLPFVFGFVTSVAQMGALLFAGGSTMGNETKKGVTAPFLDPALWIVNEIIVPFILGLLGPDNLMAMAGAGSTLAQKIRDRLGDLFKNPILGYFRNYQSFRLQFVYLFVVW
jgi:hypothetical protein